MIISRFLRVRSGTIQVRRNKNAIALKIPDKSRFPGTGDKGNGIPENFKTQEQWLNFIKTNGCGNCHQMGNYATRTISEKLGRFESSYDAWASRLSVGPSGHDMVRFITQLMTPEGGHLAALADWTDRLNRGNFRPAARHGKPAQRLSCNQRELTGRFRTERDGIIISRRVERARSSRVSR